MTWSAKLPSTQANWRKAPSSTKPAPPAPPITASSSGGGVDLQPVQAADGEAVAAQHAGPR